VHWGILMWSIDLYSDANYVYDVVCPYNVMLSIWYACSVWLSSLSSILCTISISVVVEDGFCCSHLLFCSICTSRLKLKPHQVTVVSDSIITVRPGKSKSTLNYQLQSLKETVPKVVIKVGFLCNTWFTGVVFFSLLLAP
jgi:hypothetical protein